MATTTPLDLLCFAALQPQDEFAYRLPHPLSPPATTVMPASRTLPSLVALASMNYTNHEESLPPLLGSPIQVRPSGGRAERYKKYECTGCDKRFERPSQLRTHMLSHTGEKPHACEDCGRRFSVYSNMRRHEKTCIIARERKMAHRDSDTDSDDAVSATTSSATASPITPKSRARAPAAKRQRTAHRSGTQQQWVPLSLRSFSPPDSSAISPVSVPTPPIRPWGAREERDSYEEACEYPYHPTTWRDRLPGPALMAADELMRNATMPRRWLMV